MKPLDAESARRTTSCCTWATHAWSVRAFSTAGSMRTPGSLKSLPPWQRPAAMPMDAWQVKGQDFFVTFDLPGVNAESIDLNVERNVLTVREERSDPARKDVEMIAAERPRGVFSRQLILGDNMLTT